MADTVQQAVFVSPARRARRVWVLALALAAATACGSAGSGGGADDGVVPVDGANPDGALPDAAGDAAWVDTAGGDTPAGEALGPDGAAHDLPPSDVLRPDTLGDIALPDTLGDTVADAAHPDAADAGGDTTPVSPIPDQPPVPLPDPADYTFTDQVSFLSRIQIPPKSDLPDCCFDIDGDGAFDTQANDLLDMLADVLGAGVDADITAAVQRSIDADATSYVVEFRELSPTGTAAAFNIWPAEGDLDFNGVPDQTPAERLGGFGVFQVNPVGFTEFAPVSQFTVASFANGRLLALGGAMELRLGMKGGGYLPLSLKKLSIRGELAITESGVASHDVVAQEPDALNGLQLGGVIDVKGTLAYIDRLAATCECAGVDPEAPFLAWDVSNGRLSAECLQDIVATAEAECSVRRHGFVCGSLGNICRLLPLIGALADASTGEPGSDGQPGLDAGTFAAFASLSPATLADPPIAPMLRATEDHYAVERHVTPYRFDVLENDIDAYSGTPTISEVTQPTVGVVSILGNGKALSYRNTEDRFGEVTFTYTIAANGQSSTATVVLDLRLPEGTEVFAMDDAFTVLLKRGPQYVGSLLANDQIAPGYEPFAVISAPLDWQDAYVAVAPDRVGLRVEPLDAWQDGDTASIGYGVNLGQGPNMYITSARVHITYADPEVVCGDHWIDTWAGEQCEPGRDGEVGACDPASCQFVACAGGETPEIVYRDGDGDGYGDRAHPLAACGFAAGYVAEAGDCDDSNPDVHPRVPEICGDGLNNGCRIGYDCGNEDCARQHPCVELVCDDGIDNDGDGGTDCGDPQCRDATPCTDWDCGDGVDNEGDGLTDCDDRFDCAWREPCAESLCDDGIDGDGDDLTDCADPDCRWDWECREHECGDDIDNDGDGLTDCDDTDDCGFDWQYCTEHDCADGIDNDDDGDTDCADSDCQWDPAC